MEVKESTHKRFEKTRMDILTRRIIGQWSYSNLNIENIAFNFIILSYQFMFSINYVLIILILISLKLTVSF